MSSFSTRATKALRHVDSQAVFARQRIPLHASDFPLVLLHSEKAGCSSLTKWFLFQTGRFDEALQFHPWIHQYRTKVLIRQPGYRAEAVRLLNSGEKPIIKLVRNPYNRAISSFLHVLKNARHKEGWQLSLINAALQRASKPQCAEPTLSFRDFLRFLPTVGTALDQINGHIAQQYMPAEAGLVTRTVMVERFEEGIRQLEAMFTLADAPLPLITSSRHHRTLSQRPPATHFHPADLSITSEQVRLGQVPPYDTLYDHETRMLVSECYDQDFKAYGYKR